LGLIYEREIYGVQAKKETFPSSFHGFLHLFLTRSPREETTAEQWTRQTGATILEDQTLVSKH